MPGALPQELPHLGESSQNFPVETDPPRLLLGRMPESSRKVAQNRRGPLLGREANRTLSKVGVRAAVSSRRPG
jgi:hypothetical protein